MIGSLLNQYRIIASVGAGGMGEVYRATDTKLGREVAIKVLPKDFASDPDRLRRFGQEAQTLAALSHPGVLTIFDIGLHEGAPYLVCELLEGKTLREELGASNAGLPVRKATDYALQIAHGLAAAHSKGIIHRDLKPENIFVTKDGRVKILDFGLAKLQGDFKSQTANLKSAADEAPTLADSTQPGLVMGTPAYMSPEQVRGEPADHRSDIFAFGCVLYEMLSGTRAFRRDTPVESMHAILKDEPTALAERNAQFPAALDRIVGRCLEKLPENRFQSAKDLAFALSETSSLQALPGDRRAGSPSGALGWKPVLILGLIAIMGTLAFWRPWHRAEPRVIAGRVSGTNQIGSDSAPQPLTRAREIETKGHDASLDEMRLAITLCQSVIDRNPADSEAWALMARLNCNLYDNFDGTPERLNAAQGASRNALSLAPTSLAARLAQASVYSLQRTTYNQGVDLLKRLEQEAPNDPDVLVTLGHLLMYAEQTPDWKEIIRLLDRALALRPNDPVALNDKAWALTFMGKADEADKLWDECIRRTGSPGGMTAKFYDLAWNRMRTEEAKALLEKFPSDLVFNDTAVRLVSFFWLFQHEPAKGLAFLEPFPREFIADHFDDIPKGYVVGKLYAQAGQLAAAQLEWRKALDAVNRKLAAEPEQSRLIYYKALLHSLLGEKDEAARQAEIFDQLTGPPRDRSGWTTKLSIAMELGRTDVALSIIRGDLRKYESPPDLARKLQRLEALFPAVGSTPEFQAELANVQAEIAPPENHQAAGPRNGASTSSGTDSVAVLPFVKVGRDGQIRGPKPSSTR